jgi:hypothetical protein
MKTFARGFVGGEVTPEFWGRIDDQKYHMGLAVCRNFEVLPHGPVRNRAGLRFVARAKYAERRARLIPFRFSSTQTLVLEFGHQYLRMHTQGAQVLTGAVGPWATATAYAAGDLRANAGVSYYCTSAHSSGTFADDLAAGRWYAMPATGVLELPTPYTEDDLRDLRYVQSADVMTLTCRRWYARELRRLGAVQWVLRVIDTGSALPAPTGLTATATPAPTTPGDPSTQSYVVTAVGTDGRDESPPSSGASCSNNLYDTGARNSLNWEDVPGAARYRVYRLSGGLHSFVGEAVASEFVDQGGGDVVRPDQSRTPPMVGWFASSLAGPPAPGTEDASICPAAVSYFEQRRWFAGTEAEPQTLIGSRSGTESTMTYSLPVRDDDRVKLRVVAREADAIEHIVPLGVLVLLTGSAEWVVTSVNTDAITPTSVSVRPQSYIGANDVQPVVVDASAVYAAARGGHVMELGYREEVKGLRPSDLSLRAPHLFDGLQIVDLAYAKAPYPTVWAVSSGGDLLGLTYLPGQNITAWTRHDTLHGAFESVAVVAEGERDALYAVVRRQQVNGEDARFVERLEAHSPVLAQAFHVDCGLSYAGPPATIIRGLEHLEGRMVAVLADGAVMAQAQVLGGQISLAVPASVVHVGLPITADLQTLPLAFEVQGYGQGRPKSVNEVALRIVASSGLAVGPSVDRLTTVKMRTAEPYGAPPRLRTGEVAVKISPRWSDEGAVCVRQDVPLPVTILSMTLDFAVGG